MSAERFEISPQALYQEINGEAVILDLASSTYFGLDAVGVRVWALLQEGRDKAAICAVMQDEYDVEPAVLENDIAAFLESLLAAGLLRSAA